MFDSIVNGHRHVTRRDAAPLLVSWVVHAVAVGAVVLLPLVFATNYLPAVTTDAFSYVTLAAAPVPPPPPPPPAAAAPAVRKAPRTVSTPPRVQAPVDFAREVPRSVATADAVERTGDFDRIDGVAGGVPGGVPGGVVGGITGGVVGGLGDAPPPPPPPPAVPKAPVRAGGHIQAPALLKRVPPVYPPLAVSAKLEGVVILEATVGRDGRVEEVTVLRSVPLLDKAAIDAVRQWQYAPLLLNGEAERFVLSVTVSFGLS